MNTVLEAVGTKAKKPVPEIQPVNIKQFLEKKKAEKERSKKEK